MCGANNSTWCYPKTLDADNGAKTGSKVFPVLVIVPGLGDDPDHVLTNTFPGLKNFPNDLGTIILGLKAPTSTTNGADTWNGSTSCCWADAAPPDTTTAIANAITTACAPPVGTGQWPCDPKRIWMFGHSAGAVQTHRFVCDHASLIAGAFTITGSALADGFDPVCTPSQPVSIAQMHGTADNYEYDNNNGDKVTGMPNEYVSVEVSRAAPTRTATTVQEGQTIAGCVGSLTLTSTGNNYDSVGTGTDVLTWQGCPTGVSVQLWRDNGGVHIPSLTAAGYAALEQWYAAQVKP